MLSKLFPLLSLVISAPAVAQYQPAWFSARTDLTASTNSNGAQQVLAVKNSTVLWGRMISTASTVNAIPHGAYNVGLYDTTGNSLLQVAINGTAVLMDVQADAAGNWYVLGRYLTSITLPGPITRTRSPNEPDHFIMRLSSNALAVDWYVPIGGNEKCKANAFTIRGSNIYLPMDTADGTVVQRITTTNGFMTPLWFQKGSGNTSGIAADNSGNVYLAGSCVSQAAGLVFNTFAAPAPAGYPNTAYLVRYRAGGQYDWHYYLRDNVCPVQRQVMLSDDNTLFFTGGLHDSLKLGALNAHPPVAGTDYLAARLDSNGAVSWLRQVDSNSGGGAAGMDYNTNATLLPDGTLAFYPQAGGILYWNDTVVTIANAGLTATVAAMNAATGRVLWTRGPDAAQQTTPQHIAAEGNGVYVTGNAITQTGEVRFGPYTLTMPSGTYYPFFARLRLHDTIAVVIPPQQGIASLSLAEQIHISPNPAKTNIQLAGLNALGKERMVALMDATGRMVFHNAPGTSDTYALPVAALPRGLYILRLSGTAGTIHKKVVLE